MMIEYDFTRDDIKIKGYGSKEKKYVIELGNKFCLWGYEEDLKSLLWEIADVLEYSLKKKQ